MVTQRREERGFVCASVRAKRAPTGRRRARVGENVPRSARPGLAARGWAQLERGARRQSDDRYKAAQSKARL